MPYSSYAKWQDWPYTDFRRKPMTKAVTAQLHSPHPPEEPGKTSGFRKWLPLPVMGLAIVIVVLDTTLLNVSLATIVRELHTEIRSIQWVITAYSLTLAALTITGGRLGDLLGRKRMFVFGAILFAAGSLLASLSHNVGTLIWGESIIEGVGAALMLPATASLLVATYEGRDRALALGVWGGMAGVGAAIGPVVGGYLTTHYSWRWGFRINVFVAAVLVLASFAIRDKSPRESSSGLDWMGALLCALGLFFGVFAIIEGSTYGWWRSIRDFTLSGISLNIAGLSVVPLSVLLAALFLWSFALWERRVARRGRVPLLSLGLFSIEQFRDGVSLTGMMALGQVGLLFSLPVFLQAVRGLDALHTGYALLPLSAGLLITAPLGGYISRLVPPKRIVQTGLLIGASGLGILHQMLSVNTTAQDLILPLSVYGLGLGLCFSQLANITLSSVPRRMSGAAAGVNNTVRQIGASLGTAIIGTIVVVSLTSGLQNGIAHSARLSHAQRAAASTSAVGQASAVEFGNSLRTPVPLSARDQHEIRLIASRSTVIADKRALLFTICTTLLAFLLATRLPKGINLSAHLAEHGVATGEAHAGGKPSGGSADPATQAEPAFLGAAPDGLSPAGLALAAVEGPLIRNAPSNGSHAGTGQLSVTHDPMNGVGRVLSDLPFRAGTGTVQGNLEDVVVAAINYHRNIGSPNGELDVTSFHPGNGSSPADRSLPANRWAEGAWNRTAAWTIRGYLTLEQRFGRVSGRISREAAASLLLGAATLRVEGAGAERPRPHQPAGQSDLEFARDVVRTVVEGIDSQAGKTYVATGHPA
jgi:EmrB/QacA subfamily drug resistance transporter